MLKLTLIPIPRAGAGVSSAEPRSLCVTEDGSIPLGEEPLVSIDLGSDDCFPDDGDVPLVRKTPGSIFDLSSPGPSPVSQSRPPGAAPRVASASAMPPTSGPEAPARSILSVVLHAVSGPHKGESYPVAAGVTAVIGRGRRATICLEHDSKVSRQHAQLEITSTGIRVLDLQSRNGTWINEESQTTAFLREGDKLRLGRTKFRVTVLAR